MQLSTLAAEPTSQCHTKAHPILPVPVLTAGEAPYRRLARFFHPAEWQPGERPGAGLLLSWLVVACTCCCSSGGTKRHACLQHGCRSLFAESGSRWFKTVACNCSRTRHPCRWTCSSAQAGEYGLTWQRMCCPATPCCSVRSCWATPSSVLGSSRHSMHCRWRVRHRRSGRPACAGCAPPSAKR